MTMALSLTPPATAKPLLLDTHLDAMTEADREVVLDAVESPEWSDEALADVLSRNGYAIGKTAVRMWRMVNRVQRFAEEAQ